MSVVKRHWRRFLVAALILIVGAALLLWSRPAAQAKLEALDLDDGGHATLAEPGEKPRSRVVVIAAPEQQLNDAQLLNLAHDSAARVIQYFPRKTAIAGRSNPGSKRSLPASAASRTWSPASARARPPPGAGSPARTTTRPRRSRSVSTLPWPSATAMPHCRTRRRTANGCWPGTTTRTTTPRSSSASNRGRKPASATTTPR